MEEKKDYTATQEQLARFAKALGHPARIAIMHFLAKQKMCYFGDIHEELPIAKATVSQHLKELKNTVSTERIGNWLVNSLRSFSGNVSVNRGSVADNPLF